MRARLPRRSSTALAYLARRVGHTAADSIGAVSSAVSRPAEGVPPSYPSSCECRRRRQRVMEPDTSETAGPSSCLQLVADSDSSSDTNSSAATAEVLNAK
jgi:hypothetical protein